MGADPVTIAGVGAAGSVAGGLIGASGASKAASAQTAAAQQANDTQRYFFDQTQKNLSPYMQTGTAANNALLDLTGLGGYARGGQPQYDYAAYNNALTAYNAGQGARGGTNPYAGDVLRGPNLGSGNTTDDFYNQAKGLFDQWQSDHGLPADVNYAYGQYTGQAGGSPAPTLDQFVTGHSQGGSGSDVLGSPLLSPVKMDQTTLEQTPGYQFNLTQGLKGVQNSAAARGLGTSGAALKGAASYATGLADSTYQNQFNNAVTNQTNIFNRLLSLSGNGQNAAANLGGQGTQTAANIGNNLTGAANAQGASYIAGANAITSGINNAQGWNYLNNQQGGSSSNSWAPWGQPGYVNP